MSPSIPDVRDSEHVPPPSRETSHPRFPDSPWLSHEEPPRSADEAPPPPTPALNPLGPVPEPALFLEPPQATPSEYTMHFQTRSHAERRKLLSGEDAAAALQKSEAVSSSAAPAAGLDPNESYFIGAPPSPAPPQSPYARTAQTPPPPLSKAILQLKMAHVAPANPDGTASTGACARNHHA